MRKFTFSCQIHPSDDSDRWFHSNEKDFDSPMRKYQSLKYSPMYTPTSLSSPFTKNPPRAFPEFPFLQICNPTSLRRERGAVPIMRGRRLSRDKRGGQSRKLEISAPLSTSTPTFQPRSTFVRGSWDGLLSVAAGVGGATVKRRQLS